MRNTFFINYTLRSLSIKFCNEEFNFDLSLNDKTVFWENFILKGGEVWAFEFNQIDEKMTPTANVYRNKDCIKNLDKLKKSNPESFTLILEGIIGDPELYFYTNQ